MTAALQVAKMIKLMHYKLHQPIRLAPVVTEILTRSHNTRLNVSSRGTCLRVGYQSCLVDTFGSYLLKNFLPQAILCSNLLYLLLINWQWLTCFFYACSSITDETSISDQHEF